MNLKKYIISSLYIPYRVLNRTKSFFLKEKRTRLRVLLFHDIPKDSFKHFREKLDYLSKSWNFISPEEFEEYMDGKTNLQGDNILLTFDDGFHSNRVVAEQILNPMGIKAIFFVISQFVALTEQQEQFKFIKGNLFPKWRGHPLPKRLEELKNLSYGDLNFLIETGHSIGSHTATHPNLSKICKEENLKEEIVNSADILAKKLGIKINHFSFSFGNVSFFSKKAFEIAVLRFPYIHTGMRGDNSKSFIPWAIRRDSIDLDDSLILMSSFLEGVADFKYKKGLGIYESWNL